MRAPFNLHRVLHSTARFSVLSLLATLLCGCAHSQHTVSNAHQVRAAQIPTLDRIVLADQQYPAPYSFQKGKGKLGSAREAFVDSAKMGLSAPGAGVIATGKFISGDWGDWGSTTSDGRVYAIMVGAVGGVTFVGAALAGPVVGTTELIRSFKKVSPQELEQRECALTNALNHMAQQTAFSTALQNAGIEKNQHAFEVSNPDLSSNDILPSAVLQSTVDELSLERANSREASFFLRIKTHVRLVGTTDPVVVYYEGDAEYHSDQALFLDWTLNDAVQSVAETGYQALARYYISQLAAQ